MSRTICLAAALWLACSCQAMLVQIDGSASLEIVFVSDSIIICAARTSGNTQESLFALDTRDGRVKWRTATYPVQGKGVLVSSNHFMLVTEDFLEKRSLGTGKILWKTRLDTIPDQKGVQRLTLGQHAAQTLEKVGLTSVSAKLNLRAPQRPDRFQYSEPILTGSRILLAREALSGVGCIITSCFEDWLLFDLEDGKLATGGAGGMLGRTRRSTLIGSRSGLSEIIDGQSQPLPPWTNSGFLSGRFRLDHQMESGQLSLPEWCAFEPPASTGRELTIFDSRSRTMRTAQAPAAKGDHQTAWVLLEKHLLRYSECPRYYSVRSNAPAAPPWFELFDWNGKSLGRSELPPVRADSSHWWIRFAARTNGTVQFELDGRLIAVAIPSLAITTPAPSSGKESVKELWPPPQFSPSGNTRYESAGTTNISRMVTATVPHEMSVVARDVRTGQPIWKHRERVFIKRTN